MELKHLTGDAEHVDAVLGEWNEEGRAFSFTKRYTDAVGIEYAYLLVGLQTAEAHTAFLAHNFNTVSGIVVDFGSIDGCGF